MRDLHKIPRPSDVYKLGQLVNSFTIFEKIEFSGISKEDIRNKLIHLTNNQVPERKVFIDKPDEEITFYWFKNWLHPQLKHWCKLSPKDKRGCSSERLQKDMQQDMLHFYENGQQHYEYTLEDIYNYLSQGETDV